jgi:putative transposase
MKKSKFTEQQIAFALRQAETGTKVNEIIRQMGITEQTFYRRKRKFGGLGPSELRRLRLLEEETRRLKKLVADLSLDKAMLQEVRELAVSPASPIRRRLECLLRRRRAPLSGRGSRALRKRACPTDWPNRGRRENRQSCPLPNPR